MNLEMTFKSLDAKRHTKPGKQVNISNNSTITSVRREPQNLTVGFVFTTNYEPNIGSVVIEGEVTVEDEKTILDDAYAKWEKTGKTNLPKDVAEKIHNSIITNCLVEAAVLARDLRMPPPIPAPQVSFAGESKDADTSYIR
jgi:hypothetical protein